MPLAAALSRSLPKSVQGLRRLLPRPTTASLSPSCAPRAAVSAPASQVKKSITTATSGFRPGAPRKMELSRSSGGGLGGAGGMGGNGGKPRAATGGSGGSDSGGSFFDWYLRMLGEQPVLTKAITCALLNGLGDLICQLLVENKKDIDWTRTGKFTFMGLAFVGPTLHNWYTLLNRMVPSTGVQSAIIQTLWDQFFFAPLFLPAFISVLFTIEGKTNEIVPKLKQDWFETVKANWILWIPAQVLNFRYVPPNLQVLVVNIVALAWNVYMSFQTNKAIAKTA